jgi:hypothetical protein
MRVTRSSVSSSDFDGNDESRAGHAHRTRRDLPAATDLQPVTIEKLRYLLGKATAVFGDRRIGELTSQEIAEWRMALSPGYRFEATQALRQVLHRAVAWGMLDINPAKVGVDNPVRRRKEQHPFESWEELEAVARTIGPRYGDLRDLPSAHELYEQIC